VSWVGLGQLADGLGWIGSHKMDPRTTLMHTAFHKAVYSNTLQERFRPMNLILFCFNLIIVAYIRVSIIISIQEILERLLQK